MFENLRDSLRTLSDRMAPDERRRVVATMRDAMTHAKLGLEDLRDAIRLTEQRISAERRELETARRRQGLAAGIDDQETVAIAERFATQHAERVAMLESKLMAQQHELALTEREYDEMSAQLRRAASGLAPNANDHDTAARREVDALFTGDGSDGGAESSDPLDTPTPRRTRAEREADAEDRLAALKRRMGK